jgi:predicted neuraminidase
MKPTIILIVLLLLALHSNICQAATITQEQPGLLKSEFIFDTAPFPKCHASTIAETQNGLIAAWFGGSDEGNRDVGIWVARYQENQWSAPLEAANGVQSPTNRYPCWNPVLFQPKSGPLMLFYKVGPNPDKWWGMLIKSDDGGKTWSKSVRLPGTIVGPIKNKPVQLTNGDLLAPSSTEDNGWRVHFERTSDLGRTWKSTEPVNDGREIAAIQPTILFHPGNKLQALGRTKQKKIFEIWSEDQGVTWGPMTLTTLPNPNSGIDAVTLKDGRHFLIYNNTPRGRSPLNIAVSSDGKVWKDVLKLEDDPGKEFSYPAIIQTKDGRVHATYTWHRTRIKHAVIDPNQIK